MKKFPLFAAALLSSLGSSPLLALSGGPVYSTPSGADQQTGTYQGILRGKNLMGVVIFGTTATPTLAVPAGEGLSALYFEGNSMFGTCFGTASGTSGDISAVFEASKTRQGNVTVMTTLNPNETITFDVNDVVNGSGSFLATFDNNRSANFDGSGEAQISLVKGLDVSPADPYVASEDVVYTVFGLKTSLGTPIFATLPTVQSPSVVASDVTVATTTTP